MKYVLRRVEDGKFVARRGSAQSYTDKLQNARVFNSQEEANRDKCGNERAVSLDAVMGIVDY